MKYIEINEFILVASISAICTLVMIFAPESVELLRYHAGSIAQGEWWRIITANFTHSSWNHWLLNLCGLVLIDYLFQPLVCQRQRAYLLGFCMLFNVLLLHLSMDLQWYVGLSGALHGFLIGGAILSIPKARIFSYLVIAIVSLKLIMELNWEINQATAEFINANVVEEAHFFGVISAVLYVLLIKGITLFKTLLD